MVVPSWANDRSIGSRLINTRLETVHEKPAFRRPSRCYGTNQTVVTQAEANLWETRPSPTPPGPQEDEDHAFAFDSDTMQFVELAVD